MDWLKSLWWGVYSIVMFLYLILVFLIGKIVGLKHLHKGYWSWLRTVICQNGPIWVKIAQWISNRPDLCSPRIAEELSSLREHCPVHNWTTTQKIFKEDTRSDFGLFFDSIEKKPFASGSIGQVYRAVLNTGNPHLVNPFSEKKTTLKEEFGEKVDVVIKIQHPDIHIKMKWFFRFANWWNGLFKLLSIKKFQLPISTDEMETHLMSQLNYKKEAENMTTARANFQDNPHVIIPEVFYSSPRVLVTKDETGMHYLEFKKKYPEKTRELSFVDNILTLSVMQMSLVDDLTHADLHDGNWAVRELKSFDHPKYREGYPQIIIYDWGLVTHTGDVEMNRDGFHQLRIGDFDKILDLLEKNLGRVSHLDLSSFKKVRIEANKLFNIEIQKKNCLILREKFNIILLLIRKYNFTLQSSIVSLITTLLLLQDQMVTRRKITPGEEIIDYMIGISNQLSFCKATGLFTKYCEYLEVQNKQFEDVPVDKLFLESDLYLNQYKLGDEISDVDSWSQSLEDSISMSRDDSLEKSISDQGMTEETPRVGGGVTDGETSRFEAGMEDRDSTVVSNDESGQSQNIIIENSVYQQNITEDMMKEIKQELLDHYPVHQDDVTNSNSNSS